MTTWFKRQSSMRGRLSLLLMAGVVLPMLTAGVLVWQVRAAGELDSEGHVRTDEIQVATALRLNRAAVLLQRRLDDSLGDLARRATYLRGTTASDLAAAFGDLPEAARPSLAVQLAADGSAKPESQADVARTLLQRVGSRQPFQGYVMLPLGPDASSGSEAIHQVALVKRPDGGHIVAARPLGGPADASNLLGLISGVELTAQRIVPLGGPAWTEPDAGANPPIDQAFLDRATRALEESTIFEETRGDGGIAAVPLLSPTGRPVGLAVLGEVGSDALPLIRRQAALLSSMRSILGLMAAVGALAALAMGLLAPRLVWSDIRASTDFIFRSVDRLRELVQRNQGALDEQSRLARGLMESVSSLEKASKDILRTAEALAHKAEQSAWVSQTGNQKAELAQRSVLDVRERVMDLSSQMEELERRCGEIGSLTSFINHLSTETNALSINATIQSSGSGRDGRQFSVIAGEIQRLADLSQDSTRDINHLVDRIQAASRATMGASRSGCEQVDRAKECCEELEAAFARILRWVEETTQSAHGIEASTEAQATSLQQVAQSIVQLEQRSQFTTSNFQDIVVAADELAELGCQMNATWKVG